MNSIGSGDRITHISEYGYGSLPSFSEIIEKYKRCMNSAETKKPYEDYEQFVSLDKSLRECFSKGGLGQIFESPEDLCHQTQLVQGRGNKQQLEALLTNPNVNGYVTHAYSAGGLILGAEMVDVFRDPKPVCEEYLKAQSPFRIVLKKLPFNGYLEFPVGIDVTLINEPCITADAVLSLELASPGGNTVYEKKWNIKINGDRLQTLFCSGIMISETVAGMYDIKARLFIDGALRTHDESRRFLSSKFTPHTEISISPVDFITSRPEVLDKFISRGIGNDAGAALHLVLDDLRNLEPAVRERITAAKKTVESSGGTIIFLEPFRGESRPRKYDADFPEVSPSPFFICGARGSWIPASHYAFKNPVFRLLNSGGLLGDEFGEIIPRIAFGNIALEEREVFAGCIFMSASLWLKPMDFSQVSTFSSFKLGKGEMALCQFRLEDAIGRDPVADIFLRCILGYYQKGS
jgi:hypothetical protein